MENLDLGSDVLKVDRNLGKRKTHVICAYVLR